jgi:hypothetical protein
MSKRDPELLLNDILEAGEKTLFYNRGLPPDFFICPLNPNVVKPSVRHYK